MQFYRTSRARSGGISRGPRPASWLACAAALFALTAPSSGVAQDILQDQTNANNSFLGDTVGQSFVATAPRLDVVGFQYADANTQLSGATIQVTLYAGAGTAGPLITSRTRDLTGFNGWADFDFSGVTLAQGATYTFTVANTASGRGSYDFDNSDVYANGQRYLNGGAVVGDLRFRVNFLPSIVPCNLVDNGNGTVTVTCDDGSTFTIDNHPGTNGSNGTSCTVIDNGDGTSTVTCGASSITLHNGSNGSSCSVTDHHDGTATIACSDGTSVDIRTGGSSGGCSVHGGASSPATYAWSLVAVGILLARRRRRLS